MKWCFSLRFKRLLLYYQLQISILEASCVKAEGKGHKT